MLTITKQQPTREFQFLLLIEMFKRESGFFEAGLYDVLTIINVLPTVDGSQHTPSLEK